MKNAFLILFLIVFCCESSDDISVPSMNDKWTLVKLERGFSPTLDFDRGEVLWSFGEDNVLTIDILDTVSEQPIMEDGNYRYIINGRQVIINDQEYDISISDNMLTITDELDADGFRGTFKKFSN